MADDRQGFEIRGTFYPWVEEMGLLDPVLIQRVTGMSYRQFVETWQESIAAADDDDESGGDPIVMNGLVAVAVWRQNPLWTVEKVVRFVQGVMNSDLEFVSEEDEEDGQSPPVIPPSAGGSDSTQSGNSTPSASTSNGRADSNLARNLVSSGEPGSATGSQA